MSRPKQLGKEVPDWMVPLTPGLLPVEDNRGEVTIYWCPYCIQPLELEPFVDGTRAWGAECLVCEREWRTFQWKGGILGSFGGLEKNVTWKAVLNRTQLLMLDLDDVGD